MIFEVATMHIKEGYEDDFERGVAEAVPLFQRAQGFESIKLERSIETPSRYRLIVGWGTVDDHVVYFRNSDDFQVWRSLVGHTFAAPPCVEHTGNVLQASQRSGIVSPPSSGA